MIENQKLISDPNQSVNSNLHICKSMHEKDKTARSVRCCVEPGSRGAALFFSTFITDVSPRRWYERRDAELWPLWMILGDNGEEKHSTHTLERLLREPALLLYQPWNGKWFVVLKRRAWLLQARRGWNGGGGGGGGEGCPRFTTINKHSTKFLQGPHSSSFGWISLETDKSCYYWLIHAVKCDFVNN